MAGLGISYIINILLIVHALRTGRPYYWVFIIMTPVIGPLAYIVAELLPDLSSDYRARRAMRGIRKTLDPDADIRRHQREHRLSGSVDAKRHLANELVEAGRHSEAITVYKEALSGMYEHDPDLLLGLAQALFGDGQYEHVLEALDRLIEHNPDYKSTTGHLLYARSLAAVGNTDKALEEFDVVAHAFPGPQAKIHYALLLKELDREAEARQLFADVIEAAELAPRHFRKTQKQWIAAAKSELQQIDDS